MVTTYVLFLQSKGKAFSKRRKTRQKELQTRRKAEKKRRPQG
jgi:hypothetical protein